MSDSLGAYLMEIGRTPLLTADEEVELSRRIEAGLYAAHLLAASPDPAPGLARDPLPSPDRELTRDALLDAVREDGEQARQRLIRSNLRLVVAAAKRYANRGLPLLDVIQEGNLGLIRAVEKFDYTRGYKFSTYAMWWIRQAIERGLNDKARTVRLPVHVGEELSRLSRLERRLLIDLGHEPTTEELAQAIGGTAAQIAELRRLGQETISLDISVGTAGDGRIGDLIVEEDELHVQDFAERRELGQSIRGWVRLLPYREAFIVESRYGLLGEPVKTYREIADCLGLTRERIRQLEKQALKRLRERQDLLAWAS